MDNDRRHPGGVSADNSYALSGKIMLSAVVILFFVVILMVVLHLYARWYLIRARRRQMHRARNRHTQLVFYVDPANPDAATRVIVPNRGLEASVLKSLPVFVYSEKTHPEQSECAVCLSEFEENEMGRVLPKCNHSFHIECIDMWFHSHSTCPLCRAPVEPVPVNPIQANPSSTSASEITEVGSNSGLCDSCQEENVCGSGGGPSTSSFGGRRKPVELVGVTIEVPRRTVSFEDESGTDSPAGQGFKSPMTRMLSRILSRERRPSLSPTAAASRGESWTEIGLEEGRDETRETRG